MTTIATTTNVHAKFVSQSSSPVAETNPPPGKSGDSVGHRAKAAIAGATTDQPLASNVQGKVASALARGLPVDSILALQQPQDDIATADQIDTDLADSASDTVVDTDTASDAIADSTAVDLLAAVIDEEDNSTATS